ncbi:MAG: lamin tail domain-containing protein, partial [Verrucomicrobiales bacterium]|nr:lamin tail domain-containing protein [Verrucomicrobiales bacterium]
MNAPSHRARSALTSAILFACVASALGGSASHQYFRFTPTKLRNNAAANSVQLSEMQLFLGLNQITGAIATNPRGNNPGGESPADAIDGSVSTKWLDFNKGALVLNFGSTVTIDGYRWATANDADPRDPIRFTLEGSNNNFSWTLLDDRTGSDFAVPLARNTFLSKLDLNQVANTPDIVFTISAGGVTSGSSVGIPSGSQVTLAWSVSDSTSRTLDFGAGPTAVAASGSSTRTLTATQSYTLVATNASGSDSATVTALVGGSVIPPVINELVADQTNRNTAYFDEDGNASDWIELHNPNSFAIGVGGYYLTDDVLSPNRWQIPAGTSIAPDGFLVIFASGNDRAVAGSELHANFSLGQGGEYLGLVDPDGSTVVDELAPNFPAQTSDVSYGRVPPALSGSFDFFIAPTPGAENDTPAGAPGEVVTFVTPAQTFSGSLDVSLSAVSPTAQIRYTTNGSLPSAGSALYGGPIRLNSSALVRARVYDAGFAPGEVKAEAYIELDSRVASRTSDLPIVILENFGSGSVPNGATLQASYFTLHEPDITSGRTDLTALPTKANRVGVKRRGSSTLNDPKGNYRVEFWQDDSEIDKEVNLLGMSKHD